MICSLIWYKLWQRIRFATIWQGLTILSVSINCFGHFWGYFVKREGGGRYHYLLNLPHPPKKSKNKDQLSHFDAYKNFCLKYKEKKKRKKDLLRTKSIKIRTTWYVL